MRSLGRLLLSGHVADSVSRILPNNPFLRGSASALAARWALRSLPVALGLVAAGAAYRHFTKDKADLQRARKSTRTGASNGRRKHKTAAAQPAAA